MNPVYRTLDGSVARPLKRQADGSYAVDLQKPEGAVPAPLPPGAVEVRAPAFNGGNLWALWHRRALDWSGGDDTEWIKREIMARLPSCSCGNHAASYLAAHPPVWADYFAWTVAFHNAVNARLGRPLLALEEARARWTNAKRDNWFEKYHLEAYVTNPKLKWNYG